MNIEVSAALLKTEEFGVVLEKEQTRFKVWAPGADTVRLALYDTWNAYFRKELQMEPGPDGVWALTVPKNLEGVFYTYLLKVHGQDYEVLDPYATAATANNKRCMVVDLEKTNPEEWLAHKNPEPIPLGHALLYEAHIRDFSMHPNGGMKHPGKYLCLTERGTKTPTGFATGVDHLLELGVTHLHLLPVADFASVDELRNDEYNWGYDPVLYNVPEGSYATDPIDGRVRIRELKEAIMALHQAGIRVVLDVVYNHTFHGAKSNFNYLAPGYYYRTDYYGNLTNGSGVGNELATEKPMVRKFIIESLKYWLQEYRVDGFRFDLLGLYDRETVQLIASELRAIRPDIILYGEPWVGGDSGLPQSFQFLKGAQRGMNVAVFNDDFRKALKGDSDGTEEGFITSHSGVEGDVFKGLVGSIDYSLDFRGFTSNATESINYVSCHDNLILFDKIIKVEPGQPIEIIKAMNRLGLAMVLTAFGVPFIQMGTEFLRTKQGHGNSYNASDYINQVDWNQKEVDGDLVEYVKDLIRFRKSQKIYQTGDPEVIRKAVSLLLMENNTIALRIQSPYPEDYSDMVILYYAGWEAKTVSFDMLKGMQILSCGEKVNLNPKTMKRLGKEQIKAPGIRCMIFVK